MTTDVEFQWANLPDHIIVNIFSYLEFNQRCKCAQVCKTWLSCNSDCLLWKRFTFNYNMIKNKQYLNIVKLHGHYMKHVTIIIGLKSFCWTCNGIKGINTKNACEILETFCSLAAQKVTSLFLKFGGIMVQYYAPSDSVLKLMYSLKRFFDAKHENDSTGYLTEVDFGGIAGYLREEILDTLAANHKNLQKLNIQSSCSFGSYISPECLVRVLRQCVQLSDLSVCYVCLSEEVLETFTEEGRTPVKHLAIKRESHDVFGNLSDNLWDKISKTSPNFKVTMIFNLAYQKITKEVFLDESACYYRDTIERLVVLGPPSKELEEVLINAAKNCHRLKYLCWDNFFLEESFEKMHKYRPNLKVEDISWDDLDTIYEPYNKQHHYTCTFCEDIA